MSCLQMITSLSFYKKEEVLKCLQIRNKNELWFAFQSSNKCQQKERSALNPFVYNRLHNTFDPNLGKQMADYYRDEPIRTRPFNPGDNAVPLDSVDWKTRYDQLMNQRDWDPIKDFVGMKRLGDSYHPLEPFFKFEGIAPENQTFDKIWWPMFGCGLFTLCASVSNWWSRRPFFSSILPIAAFGGLGLWAGTYAWTSSRRRARERDAVLIHYMILHENDFPRIERRKFGNIVKPWYPFRLGSDGVLLKK